ncbi:MAG: hypothetical protein ACJAXK_000019 [Yoonia sp.]|jgi:hypothetical protein
MGMQRSKIGDHVDSCGSRRSRHPVIKLAEAIRNIEDVGYNLAGTDQPNYVRRLMIIASELEAIGVAAKFVEK